MKALKITLTHGRIWTAETSSGVRSQSSTLGGALAHLWPGDERPPDYPDFEQLLGPIFNGIHDSGGDGNIAHGRAAG